MVMLQPQAPLKDYRVIAGTATKTPTTTAIEGDAQAGIFEEAWPFQNPGLLPLAMLTVLLHEASNSSISPWFMFHLCGTQSLE